MNTFDRLLLFVLGMGLAVMMLPACGEEEEVARFEEDVISFTPVQDTFLKGCTPDATGCVRVSLNYPLPEDGPKPAVEGLKRATYWFVNSYLSGHLDTRAVYSEIKPAIQNWLDEQYSKQKRGGKNPPDHYCRINGKILFENAKIITLQMALKTFTGGAHPVQLVDIYTVDVASGEWHRDIGPWLRDRDSLPSVAERYFREERNIPKGKGLRKAGFHFRRGFRLPKAMGFTPRGLLLHYNSYEVAPYAKGPTRFTIPYEAIEGVLRMQKVHSGE